MKRIIVVTIATLIASTAIAAAAQKGASTMSPGHEMQSSTAPSPRGASEYSPGDRMRDGRSTVGTTKGASEYSPGDQMNDKRKK